MKVSSFEDLDVWQRARQLTRVVYGITGNNRFAKDGNLKDQMRRASVYIMANTAEGFSRRGDKEFGQFLFIAKASASELQSHAYVALDQGYVDKDDFDRLYENLDHVARMLSKLIQHLSSRSTQPTR